VIPESDIFIWLIRNASQFSYYRNMQQNVEDDDFDPPEDIEDLNDTAEDLESLGKVIRERVAEAESMRQLEHELRREMNEDFGSEGEHENDLKDAGKDRPMPGMGSVVYTTTGERTNQRIMLPDVKKALADAKEAGRKTGKKAKGEMAVDDKVCGHIRFLCTARFDWCHRKTIRRVVDARRRDGTATVRRMVERVGRVPGLTLHVSSRSGSDGVRQVCILFWSYLG